LTRAGLAAEFLLIFVGLPLGYRFSPVQIPPLPLLWLVAGYAGWQLLRDPRFDRARLWNAGALGGRLGAILALRPHPVFWVVVMVAYPVASVYPQGVLYRAFFFERYAALFPGKWAIILASAAAFSFLHIIFRNWLAVGLTLAGGLLFAFRYEETGSLATSSFEHALYGCWLFTVGLGQYFYHATIEAVGSSLRW
jgi:membrane protease YdiL (CAAX protease family)